MRRRKLLLAGMSALLIGIGVCCWIWHFRGAAARVVGARRVEVQKLDAKIVERTVTELSGDPPNTSTEQASVIRLELPPIMADDMKAKFPAFEKAVNSMAFDIEFFGRSPVLEKNGIGGYHLIVQGLGVDQGFHMDAKIIRTDEQSDPEIVHGMLIFENYPSEKRTFNFTMRVKAPPEGPILRDVEIEWEGPINPLPPEVPTGVRKD